MIFHNNCFLEIGKKEKSEKALLILRFLSHTSCQQKPVKITIKKIDIMIRHNKQSFNLQLSKKKLVYLN